MDAPEAGQDSQPQPVPLEPQPEQAAPSLAPTYNGIGWAVKLMWEGFFVTRRGWNGKSQKLGLQRPDAHSANTLPYVYIITVTGDRVPWLCSQTDLLALDWEAVS